MNETIQKLSLELGALVAKRKQLAKSIKRKREQLLRAKIQEHHRGGEIF